MSKISFDEIISSADAEYFTQSLRPFQQLMMQYSCAMLEIETKFEVLNQELSLSQDQNPIESIVSRLKSPRSIVGKLRKKDIEVTIPNIEEHLQDVAGIRIICVFTKDIYALADKICCQDDIRLVKKKDYIKNPKPNGYRSMHLILEVPVFFSAEKKWMPVEIQLRTKAMDFWASIEHKLQYKKNDDLRHQEIIEQLRVTAEEIHQLDLRMEEISNEIDLRNHNKS